MRGKFGPLGWLLIFGLPAAGLFFGARHMLKKGVLGEDATDSVVPAKAELPTLQDTRGPAQGTVKVTLPGSKTARLSGPCINRDIWAWNSQMGEIFANGGKETTEGSLMAKRGVCLRLNWQDMVDKNQENLIKFATALAEGNPHPDAGAHFVGIMGDGAGQFLAAVNPRLEKLGAEYRAKVIGSFGFSRGEDKYMGPPECAQAKTKEERQEKCKGQLIAGYVKDGDWNIAMKFAGDNDIRNNPDFTTYDPEALNWVNAASFTDAAEKYVSNYCETRKVARNGKLTGETVKKCVDAVVTWTPGDVTVAQKRGGLLSIVSTKEYAMQMPHALIGIDKWMRENRKLVMNYLAAALEGGNQVLSSETALDRAAELSVQVYGGQEDAAFWKRYYRGVKERDAKGLMVELGGSKANNLADNLALFGLVKGKANAFAATYEVFGKIVMQQYPQDVPSIPAIAEIVDTSYLEELAAAEPPTSSAETVTYRAPTSLTREISSKSWHINFRTGRATFTPEAEAQLQELLQGLVIAGNTVVEIQGHTDSVGSAQKNQQLSEDRAATVKAWLQKQAPADFPGERISIAAYGSAKPAASNSTSEGRAQNRRVEVRVLNN